VDAEGQGGTNAPVQRSLRVCRRTSAFRGLLERHRLIVPADGFYEWRSGAHGPRQAFYIRRIDGRPLALGGLWTTWLLPYRQAAGGHSARLTPAATSFFTYASCLPALACNLHSGHNMRGPHVK
jgi:putative SOS response-associated peptidase YedK